MLSEKVGNNNIEDAGAEAIARVVEKNSTLVQLQMCKGLE